MKQVQIHTFPTSLIKFGFIAFILFPLLQLNAQVINVNSFSVTELMYTPVQKTVQFPIKNEAKDNKDLIYTSSIEYKRVQKEVLNQKNLKLEEAVNTNYNRKIQYIDTAFLSSAYGNPESGSLSIASKYNAGANGFNLSDVGIWFIPENITSGTIQVEILAGGSSIKDAIPVSYGSVDFETKQNEINGRLFNIRLNQDVVFYPNEDFYVLFTYPSEFARPQGCAVNDIVEKVKGRYWVKVNNEYVDLQTLNGFENAAWIMYAAQRYQNNIAWLTITANASGTVRSGSQLNTSLRLNGSTAGLGSQFADVIIRSNDPVNPEVRIPVELRLNEAPYFLDVPSELFLSESTFTEIEITVKDMEGDKFSLAPVMGCKFVQFAFADSILKLLVSPNKGDEGEYTLIFTATDSYKMTRELKLVINVSPNQPPIFINPPYEILVEETKSLEIKISAYDLENEKFSIRLADTYDFVQSSYNYPELLLNFSPQIGDADTYSLKLIAEDEAGSINEYTIPLYILHKNRPPVYIGDNKPVTFAFADEQKDFNILDFFTDPDGDKFSFDIICNNTSVVNVITDKETYFTLIPKYMGNAILEFALTDERGETSSYFIEVSVGSCVKPDGIIVQKWNKVLLVNNYMGEYNPDGYQWYKNGAPIRNATRQDYSSEEDTGGLLDFSADYFVRIVRLVGDTIYTCPCKPSQQSGVMSVYPNPVMRNGVLQIDKKEENPVKVVFIDLSGRIYSTISLEKNASSVYAPDMQGIYVMKIISNDNENIFRIQVY